MASSSSTCRTWIYDVFPSFGGQDVRRTFLSHLLEKLRSKAIVTFIDNNIERSCPIEPELLSAIRESEISIVILSNSYASSTYCLNELVEIHKCYEELGLKVIPVFYNVDPSHVRKQTGEFGMAFTKSCEDKTQDQKMKWMKALAEVGSIAGEHSLNWPDEAAMIEKIVNDVSNKLFTTTTNGYGHFVGIDAHIKAINSKLGLDSKEASMVGIVGPSGIGKTTIARALFDQLSSQFHYHAFESYKRTILDDSQMKQAWEEQFLSKILCQNGVELKQIGKVEQRLKNKKVLIVLDDVDDLELLKTLVGDTGWFGSGSRIIVITQDRELLKSHKINLVHEVEFPSEDISLKMFCQSAFGKNSPPDGFMELAVEVAKLAGNLPLGLNVLGSSLREKDKKEWVEMMPRIQGGLDDKIGKILKDCYNRLGSKDDQELFLYIACLVNGESVSYINDLLESVYPSVNTRIRMLAHKSLIHITRPEETVQMHILLQKLGKEIVREESINDAGKRRFLVDLEDIREVLEKKTGTENVLGICLNQSYIDIKEPLQIDEDSFKGMRNLQFIKIYVTHWWDGHTIFVERCVNRLFEMGIVKSHRDLCYLPPKLRLLHWENYPCKYIPSNFKAEYLVELIMRNSNLKRLWEGTSPLHRLKKMDLNGSKDLKEIPNLSKAKNLKVLNLLDCTNLMVLPTQVNFKSLEHFNLTQCSSLKSFPWTRTQIASMWIENISRVTHLTWSGFPLRCIPSNFCTEHLVYLNMSYNKFEKLWEGAQPLENLESMDMSHCENLKEIPDLSKATKLKKLCMQYCKRLEVLPTDVNLESLEELNLSFCSRLRTFPQISTSIKKLYLDCTAIEQVPSWIENMSNLVELNMTVCERLKNISPSIFKLRHLKEADFSYCDELKSFSDSSLVITEFRDFRSEDLKYLNFYKCLNLDQKAQEFILGLSIPIFTVLPGGEVPTYFTHRRSGSSLIITLPQSSPSHEVMRFKACIVGDTNYYLLESIIVCWRFRGLTRVKLFFFKEVMVSTDNVVVFNFGLADFELNSHLSAFPSAAIEHKSHQCELDYNDMEFEFLHTGEGEKYEIKGCGIRLLDASPSQDADSGQGEASVQVSSTSLEEEALLYVLERQDTNTTITDPSSST